MLPGEQQLAALQRNALAQQRQMGLAQMATFQQGYGFAALGAQSHFGATREKTLLEDFEEYMRECDTLIRNDI